MKLLFNICLWRFFEKFLRAVFILISSPTACRWHWNRAQNVTALRLLSIFFSGLFVLQILQKVHVSGIFDFRLALCLPTISLFSIMSIRNGSVGRLADHLHYVRFFQPRLHISRSVSSFYDFQKMNWELQSYLKKVVSWTLILFPSFVSVSVSVLSSINRKRKIECPINCDRYLRCRVWGFCSSFPSLNHQQHMIHGYKSLGISFNIFQRSRESSERQFWVNRWGKRVRVCVMWITCSFEMGRNDQLASVYNEQEPLAQYTPCHSNDCYFDFSGW